MVNLSTRRHGACNALCARVGSCCSSSESGVESVLMRSRYSMTPPERHAMQNEHAMAMVSGMAMEMSDPAGHVRSAGALSSPRAIVISCHLRTLGGDIRLALPHFRSTCDPWQRWSELRSADKLEEVPRSLSPLDKGQRRCEAPEVVFSADRESGRSAPDPLRVGGPNLRDPANARRGCSRCCYLAGGRTSDSGTDGHGQSHRAAYKGTSLISF